MRMTAAMDGDYSLQRSLQLLLPRSGRGVRAHVLPLHKGAGPRARGPAMRAEGRAAQLAIAREQRFDLGHQLRRDLGLALANPS